VRTLRAAAALLLVAVALAACLPVASAAGPTLASLVIKDGKGAVLANAAAKTATAELTGTVESLLFDATLNGTVTSAELVLRVSCGTSACHHLDRLMQLTAGHWILSLPLDEPDLIEASYVVEVRVFSGADVAQLPTGKTLTITAADTTSPALGLAGGGTKASLGANDVLRVTASDNLLWKVTHQTAGLAFESPLAAPYVLGGSGFIEGNTTMVLRAYDRGGHVTKLDITVFRDATAPTLTTRLPSVGYLGVPMVLDVTVLDASDSTLSLSGNGSQSALVAAGVASKAFVVTPDALGNLSYVLRAIDALGNEASLLVTIPIEEPFTDLAITAARLDPAGPLLLGDAAQLQVTVAQEDGVMPVAAQLFLEGAPIANATLAAGAKQVLSHPVTLALGINTFHLTLDNLTAVPELNATDQAFNLSVEVFLGRVLSDQGTYHIRGDNRGLPSVAVSESGATYALRLEDEGTRTVYAFNATGGELHWDPQNRVTDLRTPESSSSSSTTPSDDKLAPIPGSVWVILVLAALAVARRRRA
jgi:hypothetical protein